MWKETLRTLPAQFLILSQVKIFAIASEQEESGHETSQHTHQQNIMYIALWLIRNDWI